MLVTELNQIPKATDSRKFNQNLPTFFIMGTPLGLVQTQTDLAASLVVVVVVVVVMKNIDSTLMCNIISHMVSIVYILACGYTQ